MNIRLSLLYPIYCVAKLDTHEELLAKVRTSSDFYGFAISPQEVSLLCPQELLTKDAIHDPDWRMFRYEGSMDDKIVGVVASISQPLAKNEISVIVTTTYDASYSGVKCADLPRTLDILRANSVTVAES